MQEKLALNGSQSRAGRPNESQLHLLVSGMENLVAVLGMVREGVLGDDVEVIH
jgi:hypothetical protein